MVKNGDFVRFCLLLNLQSMDVFGEFLDFSSGDGVDKTRLTNTIATNETVGLASHKLKHRVFKQGLSTDNHSEILNLDVRVKPSALLVSYFWKRDLGLVHHELMDFLVEGVLLLLL